MLLIIFNEGVGVPEPPVVASDDHGDSWLATAWTHKKVQEAIRKKKKFKKKNKQHDIEVAMAMMMNDDW